MVETVNIEVYCDIEDGEEVVFGVASEHRPDLPKPFDAPLQRWVRENFGGALEPGEGIKEAAELEYEPNDDIIRFRKKTRETPLAVGDKIRIDIPDKDDPDFEEWHGRRGKVIDVLRDAAGEETGDDRDSILYRVRTNDGDEMDFRWRDLRFLEQD